MKQRELVFTEKHFERIRRFVTEQTGIVINASKFDMVYGRLSRRVRQTYAGDFDQFCSMFESGDAEEQDQLINAITTNLTAFFREKHHFSYLADTLLPQLRQQHQSDRRLRIWSAGCSTGEEPYSIAMTLCEGIADWQDWDIKILATDLDGNVIEAGRQGVYRQDRLTGLPAEQIKRFFQKGGGSQQGLVRVRENLRQLVHFKRLNLLTSWPMQGPFDVIFCRNVVIYFDKETQRQLFARFANILRPQGHLFIGHSESLYKVSDSFTGMGQTIYKKLPG